MITSPPVYSVRFLKAGARSGRRHLQRSTGSRAAPAGERFERRRQQERAEGGERRVPFPAAAKRPPGRSLRRCRARAGPAGAGGAGGPRPMASCASPGSAPSPLAAPRGLTILTPPLQPMAAREPPPWPRPRPPDPAPLPPAGQWGCAGRGRGGGQ